MIGTRKARLLLRAAGPRAWPAGPTEMSVSSLAAIEACPRRWALAAADYPEIWNKHGYPPRAFIASLTGTVVHLALETIMNALAHDGCGSVKDAHAVQAMKHLGGYTMVVNDCIQSVVDRYNENPRVKPAIDFLLRSLKRLAPEIRTETQNHLTRLKLPQVCAPFSAAAFFKDRVRNPLGPGVYPELEIRADSIGWRGTVDLLILSDTGCEILDFKTGAPDDSHRSQIRVYALLWSRDFQLNPTARLVNRLVISYPTGNVQVDTPTPTELDALERRLVQRREAALDAISTTPPDARPSTENCRYCGVRHLCGDYWRAATAGKLGSTLSDSSQPAFSDLQLFVTARHGPLSWDSVVEESECVAVGVPVLLRGNSPDIDIQPGDRIRVMDAQVSKGANGERHSSVATLTTMSEIFLCSGTA